MDMFLLLTIAAFWLSCPATVYSQHDGDNYRLPNNSYPLRYDLQLTTYIHDNSSKWQFRFDGKVRIKVFVKDEGNSSITVHYRQTTITHVKLWSLLENGTERVLLNDNTSFVLDPKREFVTVTPSSEILNGTYYLEFEYHGELRNDNAGFYRSSYVDNENRTRWLATTQLSSTDARHVFPCYDEPGIRAPIGLTIIHGSNYTALSNNVPRAINDSHIQQLDDGFVKTVFYDTPSMQPYLLGIVVSDFVSIFSEKFPRHRVFARYNAVQYGEGNFILEAGYKILSELEKHLETEYPLAKLDHVGIPDFAPGAMENYGLITYKEERFFYDNLSSPMKQKSMIASVVGHEVGHQFFGNMVSPAWWSYLWMKEGFATYFEYLASDLAFPDLRIWETYSVDKMHNVFELDSLSSSRPMTHYVNSQTEVAKAFDNIAYDKGGSIMRMFQYALGPETFRQALIRYLRKKAFQAAHPEDFAAAMQFAIDNSTQTGKLPSNVSALTFLKSWTEQSGYPVLHVSRGDDLRVTLTQERYLLKEKDTNGTKWILPFNFATARNSDFTSIMSPRWLLTTRTVLDADGWGASDWIIFNKQQTGYYRVNYDDQLWYLTIAQLYQNSSVINNINRAQLIDDSLNLARSGRLSYNIALRLLRYLANERDFVPWAAASRNMELLIRLFSGSPQMNLFQRFLRAAINPAFTELGLTTNPMDDLPTRRTRELVSKWACMMGSEKCLNKSASILLESLGTSRTPVDPDLRNVIYCYGLQTASKEIFLTVWREMQASQNQATRAFLIHSLGCTQHDELKWLLLNTSIADESEGVNYFGQERGRILYVVYSNGGKGIEIALEFFTQNLMKINELYNKGNFGGRAIITAINEMSMYIINSDLNSRFQTLIKKVIDAGLLKDTDTLRALEQSSENLQWVQSKGKEIEAWLQEYYSKPEEPLTTTLAPTTTQAGGGAYKVVVSTCLMVVTVLSKFIM
ncbi:aminopeptidase N-like [Toxorhynchites rutilus septentrionalis]|uniref:aminopeptidase N-like n=1 Tax=Toxorhynchites rutilus septentrionalis TaxID=329112 RepID=UPI00247A51F8|nr:aminopeptidase N-like [Toxorhynchites rutilus septentrionalis]